MENKYIHLKFTNAKLFVKNTNTKDFVTDVRISGNKLVMGYSRREKRGMSNFKEPITVHQVSNMMHTLVGERPVPSFRKTFYNRNGDIFRLAMKSYIKITTPKIKNYKDGNDGFIYEIIRLDKSAFNSWRNPQTIEWFKVKKYMGLYFDDFIKLINESLGYDVLKEPFENLRLICFKKGITLEKVFCFLKKIKKTPIINFLTKTDFKRAEITSQIGETLTNGIDNVVVLDGEILIPYNEDFVSKIIKSSTNILDGGFVKVLGIRNDYEIDDYDGFILISEISDERI